jgi:transcriptional regulator with XRE-family HTH domain
MDSTTMGRKIRRLREELGVSSSELARRARVSQSQVSRLEHGKHHFRMSTLERIAEALGVHPVYFYMEPDAGKTSLPESVYGLIAEPELRKALSSPVFVKAAKKLADAFLHRRRAFSAVVHAMAAILECR